MIGFENGTVFLGFTKKIQCQGCNNQSEHVLRLAYLKQSVFFIPIATSNKEVCLVCPVCEKSQNILTSKFWSSNEKLTNVVDLLESGKELTKQHFKTMDWDERERMLKRLNALEAHSLVKFLGT